MHAIPRNVLNKSQLKQTCCRFIQSYLNYGNMAWNSAYKSKLETLRLRSITV